MLATGYWRLGAGYWMLDAKDQQPKTKDWILDAKDQRLDAGW